jgi:toxin ParE1/3/4
MRFTLSIRREAEVDLERALGFYDEREAGLGNRFHDDVAQILRLIQRHPLMYPPADLAEYRKARLKRFPYHIYYRTIGTKIFIVAVHPAKSGTEWHEGRI